MGDSSRSADGKATKVIGDYELLAKVGQGGMGSVFRARQISTGRTVAFKALPPSFAKNENLVARFKREVRILLGLKHEHIVEGLDSGQVGNLHYLAMEYVDGRPVTERLVAEKRLESRETLAIMLATARGLAYAHSKGLIHRDVKPDNLGLARQQADVGFTMIGTKLGTPKYMSPEQVQGVKTIDGRADVYSLGATAYYLLTGHAPHDAPSGTMIMRAQLSGKITPVAEVLPDADANLAAVIDHCLEKKPEDRYQTMDQLVEDLQLAAAGKPPKLPARRISAPDVASGKPARPASARQARPRKAARALGEARVRTRQPAAGPSFLKVFLVTLLVGAVVLGAGAWALFLGPLKSYGDAVKQRLGLGGRATTSSPDAKKK
ncbi:MAG: serine/threonine-protein kinase [Planctomycetota bacterium]|jgi:serine/threonine protein kinase